jgi:hypothetical protein
MLVGGYIAARAGGSGRQGSIDPPGLDELLGTLLTFEDERSVPRRRGDGSQS